MSRKNPHLAPEFFRDSLATIKEDGNRNWVYPKQVKGMLFRYRTYVSWFLLILLFSGPFIRINGHPFLLFNIFERKFIIFGSVFWPQDTQLLIFLLLIVALFIILFTTVFGRIWCGWACPQTLFMEMVFRKIEYWIEGDSNQQRALDSSPWNVKKILKKGSKLIIFSLISLLIGHILMAYLIGVDKVVEIVSRPPAEYLLGFIGLLAFSGVFLFVFSWFREQACLVVCPYGRLQGVLLDRNSINVMYDYVRGEPRRKAGKKNQKSGDCVGCDLCVQVCPTGIDIRNGLQMECINCTACIDSCNEVMLKVGRPAGLIRYTSENSIEGTTPNKLTGKVKLAIAVLVLLILIFFGLLFSREDIQATVTRFPGMTYQQRNEYQVSNLYQITLINKTFCFQRVKLESPSSDFEVEIMGVHEWVLDPQSKFEGRFFLIKNKTDVKTNQEKVHLSLIQGDREIDRLSTNFTAPLY